MKGLQLVIILTFFPLLVSSQGLENRFGCNWYLPDGFKEAGPGHWNRRSSNTQFDLMFIDEKSILDELLLSNSNSPFSTTDRTIGTYKERGYFLDIYGSSPSDRHDFAVINWVVFGKPDIDERLYVSGIDSSELSYVIQECMPSISNEIKGLTELLTAEGTTELVWKRDLNGN